jgi:hypothetical protein
MDSKADLQPFRDAPSLRWHPFTVFEPGRGDDGQLIASTGETLSLDTWTWRELDRQTRTTVLTTGQHSLYEPRIGINVVVPLNQEAMREAIREWCREFIGRDDVAFDE